ncbi:Mu transposase C-terminal domain-containing protein [Glycomyces salinus]|uniref:Mu transposase C-terminal domain-containing protein n=1 Tax=Glycomyces salinus TaxID=980294 RepID=UPI0018EBD4EC|nr:Mu transposase C-terminal domain-containing protein [Glycomyces salinus]
MSVARPAELATGTEVVCHDQVHTVVAVTAADIRLRDPQGMVWSLPLADVFADPSFAVVAGPEVELAPQGVLESLPPGLVEQAEWWQAHLIEVLTGRRPEADEAVVPRPEYDPEQRSLRQREQAKLAELAAAGHSMSLRTLQRKRLRFEQFGLWGLIDARYVRQARPYTDARVVDAIERAMAAEKDQSTGTVSRLRRRVEQLLAADGVDPAEVMPSDATFYRLAAEADRGRHTFTSAATRRSLARRPEGPFGAVTATRPGEWMLIDSTPIDIQVVLDNGMSDRVELTWILDWATRSIPAALLRPSTRAADAAVLLAHALTPEPMRPGWAEALQLSRSVLPYRQLIDIEQRLADAAARPVIVPETIVVDHGKVYRSRAFDNACRAWGINVQPTHKGSPWEKGGVERSFDALNTLFAQYVAGFVGRSVERRGTGAATQPVWSMPQLQALLDEWIVAVWQNRPHNGLRHPMMPAKALTPNEQYAVAVDSCGFVSAPITAEDYIELLPFEWRQINSYGIQIAHRRYDAIELSPHRRRHSGVRAHNGLWEVHYDPYDLSRVWVRGHLDGGWIQATWTHLSSSPVPFGEQIWNRARRILTERGEHRAGQAAIAAVVEDLLDQAEAGPSRIEQRIAARTREATPTTPLPPAEPEDTSIEPDIDEEPERFGKVIPLPVFDARKEAEKWY